MTSIISSAPGLVLIVVSLLISAPLHPAPKHIDLGSSPPIASAGQDKTPAPDLIARFRDAAGRERRDLRSITAEGIDEHSGRNYKCPFWYRFSHPDQYQVLLRDMAIPENGPGGWPKIFTINHQNAWMHGMGRGTSPFMPPGHPQPIDPLSTVARRETLKIALGIVPEWAVDSSLVTLSYDGRVSRAGRTLAVARVSDAAGPFGKLYFDNATNLPTMLEYDYVTNIPRPTRQQEIMHYDDFRSTSGIMLPFRISREFNGRASDVRRVNSYEVNEDIPGITYRKPSNRKQLDAILPPPSTTKKIRK